jgi:hypothetical protein
VAEGPNESVYRTALSLLSTGGLSTQSDVDRAVDTATEFAARDKSDLIDREQIVRRLRHALDIYQPDSIELTDDKEHRKWLEERRSEINWAFTERYLRYLRERENRPPGVLDRLDRTTMKILGHLGDPARKEPWDRRGLVVGGVQSGKTGNILGLICRAADAGYRLIVVLAGTHNNLRSQTQLRIDEGFLGFDTQVRTEINSAEAGFDSTGFLGVGALPGAQQLAVASLTRSTEDGDFLIDKAKSNVVPLGLFPVVLVVKKHAVIPKEGTDSDGKKPAGILNNLTQWILETAGQGDPKRVQRFPLLVIDDEADNASISTKYGGAKPAPSEVTPTAVNAAIRSLLNAFDRKSYVGYTATPNANIYIPHDVDHSVYGNDLFPENFIEYIVPPSNYFGPARVFGSEDFGDDPDSPTTDLGITKAQKGLIRTVKDHTSWLPDKHKKGTRPGKLPQSLRDAIRSFVLVRAVRLARGQFHKHNSMLVHVSQYLDVQNSVRDQIRDELEELRGRIRFGDGDGSDVRAELKDFFQREFVPVMETWITAEPVTHVDWDEVEPYLEDAIDPIEIMVINGESDDALAYFERRWEGLNVIAIGGNKLSRGLTLEGLSVSYYLRAAGNHDTLLQMGRWFGYRDGYEDVCRLYTTAPLVEAFRGVTEANLELISELEDMAQRGTPKDYGLKIRHSVAGMLVTARNKMPGARTLRIGFSGQGPSTVVMHCDHERAEKNRAATVNLIRELDDLGYARSSGLEESGKASTADRPTQIWSGVDGLVLASEFFDLYESPASAWRVQGDAIAKYIRNRVDAGELIDWTVALLSSNDVGAKKAELAGYPIGLTERRVLSGLENRLDDGLYSIKQLLSPRHEWLGLSQPQRDRALEISVKAFREGKSRAKKEPTEPGGRFLREMRPKEKGLLLIYPLRDPVDEKSPESVEKSPEPVMGFFVSFPKSPGAPAVDYVVNRIFLEEYYGDDDSGEAD